MINTRPISFNVRSRMVENRNVSVVGIRVWCMVRQFCLVRLKYALCVFPVTCFLSTFYFEILGLFSFLNVTFEVRRYANIFRFIVRIENRNRASRLAFDCLAIKLASFGYRPVPSRPVPHSVAEINISWSYGVCTEPNMDTAAPRAARSYV